MSSLTTIIVVGGVGIFYFQIHESDTQKCWRGYPPINTCNDLTDIDLAKQNTTQSRISKVIIPLSASNSESEQILVSQTLVVVLGINNTVVWVNYDDAASRFTADDGSWTTGLIKSGNSASVTFNHTGTFGYHGEPHPWQKGTIAVYRGDNPSEKEILSDFKSKLITQEQAMKITREYIQQHNITLLDSQEPNFHSVIGLAYVTLNGNGSFGRMDVNTTGIPETGLERWWIELEKSYLNLPSNRSENGFVVWVVVFKTCDNCAVPFLPTFAVDAITGKVLADPGYFDPNQHGWTVCSEHINYGREHPCGPQSSPAMFN